MKACTKCGNWHTNAEKSVGTYLSCTEVKAYWAGVSLRHKKEHGHYAQVRIRKDGQAICLKCRIDLDPVL